MKRRRFLQLAAIRGGGAAVAWFAGSAAEADVLSFAPALQSKPMVSAESSDMTACLPHELLMVLLESTKDGVTHLSVQGFSASPWLPLQEGRRYRLRIMNATDTAHCVSLRHHRFELARVLQTPVTGVFVRAIQVERFNVVEADVIIRRPGAVFLRYERPFVLD